MTIYTTNEFAKKIGVCPRTLWRWEVDGLLVAHRTPTNRKFYTEEQLRKYLKQSQRDRYISELCEKCGKDYTLKTIDFERCIYRNLGNGYDMEICLVSDRHKRASIYVWWNDPTGGYKVVESHHDIPHEDLSLTLKGIERRYANEQDN